MTTPFEPEVCMKAGAQQRIRFLLMLIILLALQLAVVWTASSAPLVDNDSQATLSPSNQYRTAPADLPRFEVTRGVGSPAPGYIFISYFDYFMVGRNKAYLLILDNNGEPVYYNPLPGIPVAMDFKKQPNGQLTYYVTLPAHLRFYALDNSYQQVATYEAGNGYTTDLHDLQILDNDHVLLLVYQWRVVDMSAYGGSPTAQVIDCIVQELDEDKNVVFEWNSADHIDITDTNQPLDDDIIRYIHCNSVEQDFDGNLLLSNRNLDEITKIDRFSGQIIWRLGGKQSDFQFIDGVSFSVQHDARRLPNGNISLFDNGNSHSPPRSRGAEYELNEENMTAKLVREYRTTPDTWALAMGSMQKLQNGNVFIGWGRSSKPMLTEFTEGGETVVQINALEGTGSYRAFRFPWQGFPSWPPALLTDVDDDMVHLYFSWNGSTEVTAYQVYGGRDRDNLSHLATVTRDGFETTFSFKTPLPGLWQFQVKPLDKGGTLQTPSVIQPAVVSGQPLFFPITMAGKH